MPLLLEVIIALIIVGVCLYLVRLIPMDPRIQQVITVLVIACVVIWALMTLVPMLGSIGPHSGHSLR